MRGIQLNQTTITVSLTPDDWDLYTSSMDCTEAARDLNKTVEWAVNQGFDLDQIRQHIEDAQRRQSKFGANDTEGRSILRRIIEFLEKSGFPKQNSAHFIKA